MYDGYKYPSSEHAFQAAKCVNENDKEKIRNVKLASAVKRAGRVVQLRFDWESEKQKIMKNILKIKFRKENLYDSLMKTENSELIEENKWHDTYWGVCVCEKHIRYGENVLGKLLMEIRDE